MTTGMIIVGMADLKVAQAPDILTTLGLGSCVGIVLYDPVVKVAGLAHVMLPDSTQISNRENIAKFVDTGTIELIKKMMKLGAKREHIKAKLAGGAQMFALNAGNEALRIGERNVEAAIHMLSKLEIPVVAKEVGETYGRTIEVYAEDGSVLVKTIGHGTKYI